MNIYESIAAIMQEIPAIGKDKKNQQQNFNYRGIDDVMNALQPILSKHRVFVVPEVLAQNREERKNSKGGTLMYSIMQIKYSFLPRTAPLFPPLWLEKAWTVATRPAIRQCLSP